MAFYFLNVKLFKNSWSYLISLGKKAKVADYLPFWKVDRRLKKKV
jgi:hypothetical protein